MTRLLVLLLAVLPLQPIAGQEGSSAPDSLRVERLVALGKLWSVIKFFHPHLAYREDIDWDAALVAAIPKVNTAPTSADFASAVQGMLATLSDPVTRVVQAETPGAPSSRERHPIATLTRDSVLVVTMTNYADLGDWSAATEKLQKIGDDARRARGVVFDLRRRVAAADTGVVSPVFDWSGLSARLASDSLAAPGQRGRMHSGFPNQEGYSSGEYYSAFYVIDGQRFAPSDSAITCPIMFLINEGSELPAVALALQEGGRAAIVSEGAASDASAVRTMRFTLPDSLQVEIRLGELLYADGSGGLRTDAIAGVSVDEKDDPALSRALDLLRAPAADLPRRPALPARASPLPDRPYREMRYPTLEYRLLAAFRIWSTIHYFFPYKHLIGGGWDAVLREFIPRLEAAPDSLYYALTVAEMVTRIHDTHGFVDSDVLWNYLGRAEPPVRVRMIEGLPVITRVGSDSLRHGPRLEVGDVIVEVDSEEAGPRLVRYSRYIAASTAQSRDLEAAGLFLRGPEGSLARLKARGRDGRVKIVTLTRRLPEGFFWEGERSGEVLRMLPGNVGYADLDRLTVAMVDSMFDLFRNTRAIVFDMRGYPLGTAWFIAPRLTDRNSVVAAKFRRPLVMSPDSSEWSMQGFDQLLPPTSGWRYTGKTVMLIDERTLSQAEHTGLFLEAANGTAFIGSTTGGANGDVTNFYVPGGILVQFSGHDVRHADGRQLQRLGLQPDVEARPTIAGLRAGRDEVLEKALQYLDEGP